MDAFAVYLCGDELPMVLFPFLPNEDSKGRARLDAEAYPSNQPHWMDKEIREVRISGNLER